jgi:hypothetical protein
MSFQVGFLYEKRIYSKQMATPKGKKNKGYTQITRIEIFPQEFKFFL